MNDFENGRAGVREHEGITLGSYSYLRGFQHNFGGSVTIGNYTGIGTGCVLLSGKSNHASAGGARCVSNYPWEHAPSRDITIGNDVWIGVNVIVLGGVTIGDGAIIGAGCVVSKNVDPYAVVVGSPQRVVRHRFTQDQIASLLKIRWWDWPHPVIDLARRLPEFQDVRKFIEIADRLAPLARACAEYVEET